MMRALLDLGGRIRLPLLTGFITVFLLSPSARAGSAAELTSLVLESGSGLVGFTSLSLSPTFNSSTLTYSATIPFEHEDVNVVEAIPAPGYDVSIVPPTSFPAGATTSIVINLADDPFFPSSTATYTINVTRGAPNNDAALANLVVSGTSLSPTFQSLTFNYSAVVGYSTTSVTITPTALQAGSTIEVNDIAVADASASAPIALSVGSNQVVILVTSSGGSVTKGYEVIVTRMARDSDNDGLDDHWESLNGLNIGLNDSLLDKDHDGLQNIFEYAFGSDPCDGTDAAHPQLGINAQGFATISFFKAITDGSMLYAPEIAGPGASPIWTGDFINQTSPGSPQYQLWRDNAGGSPSPPPLRLLRVRVTPNF